MGMDVYGVKPTSKAGEYFQRSCWGWRPLWDYCVSVAPDVISDRLSEAGHYNDGDGLNAIGATRLAAILKEQIENGSTIEYVRTRDAGLRALPDEVCDLCNGTGKRTDMTVANGCNKCRGDGRVRPHETWYPLEVQDVIDFKEFLEACGGFQIH